jgi:hypothetical protein
MLPVYKLGGEFQGNDCEKIISYVFCKTLFLEDFK